jgi:hypothetical protein
MKTLTPMILFLLILSACQSAAPSSTPTEKLEPTISASPTKTPYPTDTIIPSSTPTPQPTITPEPPDIPIGTMFWQWGWTFPWERTTSPYLVWGAQLRDKMNSRCEGFICDGVDLRLYDPQVWHFLGRGEYGKTVFTFEKPLDTFVIVYKDRIGFDALSGMTVDGKTVAYGYLTNGKISASYLDGGNISFDTVIEAENKHKPVSKPCGIIDPNPDGDKNFSLTGGEGGILWNFLDNPWGPTLYSTRKGYSLVGLTIISESFEKITQDQICP